MALFIPQKSDLLGKVAQFKGLQAQQEGRELAKQGLLARERQQQFQEDQFKANEINRLNQEKERKVGDRIDIMFKLLPHATDDQFVPLINELSDIAGLNLNPNDILAKKDEFLKGIKSINTLAKTNPGAAMEVLESLVVKFGSEPRFEEPIKGLTGRREGLTQAIEQEGRRGLITAPDSPLAEQLNPLQKQQFIEKGAGAVKVKTTVQSVLDPVTGREVRKIFNALTGEELGELGQVVSKGFKLTTNPDGTFTLSQGVPTSLTKKTVGDIEKKIIESRNAIARLEDIGASFKPEFLEISTRVTVGIASLREKFGQRLTPDEKSKLVEFTKFKRKSLENINLIIKEITGAALSEKEAIRIRGAEPDPGEGIFDGDGPTVFKTNLDDKIETITRALKRFELLNAQGLTIDSPNLPSLELEKRGQQLLEQGLSEDQIAVKLIQEGF